MREVSYNVNCFHKNSNISVWKVKSNTLMVSDCLLADVRFHSLLMHCTWFSWLLKKIPVIH